MVGVRTTGKTVALTGDENVLIRYASTALCAIQAQPRNGASLVSVQAAGKEAEEGQVLLGQVDGGEVRLSATDSRGYETVLPVQVSIVPYVKLTCNPQPGRTDPGTGIARVTVEGSCYCGSFGAEENTLLLHYGIAGEPTQSVELPIGEDHTYSAVLELPGLDYTQSYDLEIWAEDKVCSLAAPVRIGQAIPVFDWGKDYFRFNVPMMAPAVNDRGLCSNADTARLPGVYRLEDGLLLVFVSGDMTAQLAIGANGKRVRLLTPQTVYDWEDI